jgi:hypothetical protein
VKTKFPRVWLLLVAVLIMSGLAPAQSGQQQKRAVVVNGNAGEATVYRFKGHRYIELEALARIANGSVTFQGNRIILTLPGPTASSAAVATPNTDQEQPEADPRFSKAFASAGIQALATIKQWRSTLAYAVQRGVPGDGSRTFILRDKAADGVRLASAAASTDSDKNGSQLLTNHFNNVQAWTSKLIDSRKSMGTANLSMSPNALNDDPLYQKIDTCSAFLGKTFAGGAFQDDPSCH